MNSEHTLDKKQLRTAFERASASYDQAAVLRTAIELFNRPGADLSLELHAADERRILLEEVLGCPVRFYASWRRPRR